MIKRKNFNSRLTWKAVLLVSVIISLLLLCHFLGLGGRLGQLRDWIRRTGFLGPMVFIFIYAIVAVAALPIFPMSIAAGSMFGSILGVIVVSVGTTLGATLSFLVSRYFAGKDVEEWLSTKEKFRSLYDLTEKRGAIIVAVTRLVPIFPYTLLNYGFGLTKVHFKTYLFWSWLCMIPATVVYVIGADAVTKGLAERRIPWVLVGVFIIAIILTTFLVRHARAVLKEEDL